MRRRKNEICAKLCAGLAMLSLFAGGCGVKQVERQTAKTGQETKEEQTTEEDAQVETGKETTVEVSGEGGIQTKYTIGISMPDASAERWEKDGQDMKKRLTEAGCEVILYDAQGDIEKQRKDIAALLEKEMDLLIVGAVDEDGLGDVLDDAAEQSVKVIAYDKLLMNTDSVDYYVSFDHYRVGKGQADYVVSLLGLTEDMIENEEGKHFTIRIVAEEKQDLQSFFLYQGMEDTLISYMWGDTPVLEVVQDTKTGADVRLEQCLEETDTGADDKYIVGVAVGNGAYAQKTEGKQLFYEDSRREAEITCLLAGELLEKGTVTASFLEELDDACRFDRHSYDNGTGIIPAFLIEAEMIPGAASSKLR